MFDFSFLRIEKDVPVPSRKDSHPVRLLIAQLEVGDSIFFPDKMSSQTIYSHYKAEKRNGKKFSIRKLPGGNRLWRIE